MNKGFTNEMLVKNYKDSRDESYLAELIKQNTPLLRILVTPYLSSIPHSEYEDLIAESYMPMLKAIEDFDEARGLAFTTLLKAYVRQNLNRLYNEATRKKRYTGSAPVSYEALTEINKEGGCEMDSYFTVECADVKDFEFQDLINSLSLNDKEQVAVTILMDGGSKGEVAKALNCTPATANYYFKSIRKKFVLAGVSL
ncbi:sigma-70 family RNA polymerase sigma factor [Lachnospiraceae bacterium oral taxon 500]|nr:sigma-70 family RNA polymerase sigma factor [Lachnospiraceae bacterium oral taxon 500]